MQIGTGIRREKSLARILLKRGQEEQGSRDRSEARPGPMVHKTPLIVTELGADVDPTLRG